MKNRYLISIFLLPFIYWIFNQAAKAQNNYTKFDHITVGDGLSSNRINCIYRDSKNYLWISTGVGLDRYDSYVFEYYKSDINKPGSISSSIVRCIIEDQEKNLWFGTSDGLNLFDKTTESFKVFRNDPSDSLSLNGNVISSIYQDFNKNLWIITDGNCLNKWNPANLSFQRYQFENEKFESQTAPAKMITSDSKGNLWIVCFCRSLYRFDPATEEFTKFDDPAIDLGTNNNKCIYSDKNDKIWIGTDGRGLFSYDPFINKFTQFGSRGDGKGTNQNIVLDIIAEDDRYLLLAVNQGGINRFDKISGSFEYIMYDKTNDGGLNNNGILCFHKDKEGILWIGTSGGGINYINPKKNRFEVFRNNGNNIKSLSYDFTGCFFEDHEGYIWIGTDGGGVNVFDPKTGNFVVYQHDPSNPNSIGGNVIRSIAEDNDFDIWIGTWDGGLNRYDRKTGKFYNFLPEQKNPRSISSRNIWNLIVDHTGIIWIGFHNGGIDLFDKKIGVIKRFRADPGIPGALSNNGVRQIIEDSQRNIWVCTWAGLNLYDSLSSSFKVYKKFPDNDILQFLRDREGNLWAGTNKGGLCLFRSDGTIIKTYNDTNGLPDNGICSILEDSRQNLWISTNNGLCRFNTTAQTFRTYTKEDGLQGNQFFFGSYLKTRGGKFYFGGYEGFNSFYPDSLKDNDFIPPVYINDFQLFGKSVLNSQTSQFITSVSEGKEIKLNYKQSVFSFGFVAINYTFSRNNKYAFMLEGFDKEWNYRDASRRYSTYTNLDYGTYTFHVKASNNDGIWNEKGASIKIIILPPWWKTWWFKTFFYLFMTSLLFLAFYLRVTFYRNLQKKLLVLVRDRTSQLEEAAVNLEEKQEQINSQNEELMAQRDELHRHHNQLELLVEERTKELIEAKDKAQESDRLKSSFLANLSHEIRTPLNAILGFSALLADEDLAGLERKEYKVIVQNSSNTLLDLINDVLDISRIEAGQMELVLKPVSLKSVTGDLFGIFDALLKRQDTGSGKKVVLKVNIRDDISETQIITDRIRLVQVLSNLISNAIKFTNKGYIEVGCNKLPGTEILEFYVKDTGIGIKEENLQLIFERFRKIEDDKSQLHRGTGLGLAISSQLVKLLGGTMYLTSKIGEGSVFYFTLPLIKSEVSSIPLKRKKQFMIFPDLSNYEILVAEDDISSFLYFERLLKKTGAKIFHAADGKQVLSLLKDNPEIKLVLMDIKMPLMDGIEALHEMRKMNILIPVIAQTAYALANEVEKLKDEGFDDYISKPINPEYFYQKICHFLK
jgi:signal transduction histidine kinase/ligand-binding sensor domain-containing protein/CheY-like chemotaxis protein